MTATSTRIDEAATAAGDAMSGTADRLRDEFDTTERRIRKFVEEYPLTCFFGAVVVGYLAGRIATRL